MLLALVVAFLPSGIWDMLEPFGTLITDIGAMFVTMFQVGFEVVNRLIPSSAGSTLILGFNLMLAFFVFLFGARFVGWVMN